MVALVAVVPAAGFVGLWIAGPQPVSFGPYVQNVTTTSAEVCCFDEVPSRVRVRVALPEGGERVVDAAQRTQAHRLAITGLRPAQRYRYTILDGDGVVARYAGEFSTAPLDAGRSFSFAAVGDSGDVPAWFHLHRFGWGRMRGLLRHAGQTRQWQIAEWIAAKRPDFFVHLGDVIYTHEQLAGYREAFFAPFRSVLEQCPLVANFGNHDMHTWARPEFFTLFAGGKQLEPKQGYRDWSFTFTWGSVRFLVLDAFWQKWEADSAMRGWLEMTLLNNRHPRVVAILNFPPFSDEGGVHEMPVVQQQLWPILARRKVDLVLCGDSHNYQRFKPIDGVTLVIAGTGGKSLRPIKPTARLAKHAEAFGFLLVKVTGRRIEGEFWTGKSEPLDRFVLE